MSTIDSLNWRYACKEFDPEKKLSDAEIDRLLESLRLAPSSFGLQPWSFVLVTDPAVREELVAHSWGQRQVADASHLIVLCRRSSISHGDVDRLTETTATTRSQDPESLAGLGKMIKGFLDGMSDDELAHWSKDQVYLALGSLLTVCAVEGIDACPMEGFAPDVYDKILDLPAKGLNSTVLCTVGHRRDTDKYASLAKVRYPADDVIVRM